MIVIYSHKKQILNNAKVSKLLWEVALGFTSKTVLTAEIVWLSECPVTQNAKSSFF